MPGRVAAAGTPRRREWSQSPAPTIAMCNLYHMAPRGHVEVFFDPETGAGVPSYTMITVNCDGLPLLGRLHKPDPKLPDDAQDKRSVVPLQAAHWTAWFAATPGEALAMLRPPPTALFDLSDARRTDRPLGR